MRRAVILAAVFLAAAGCRSSDESDRRPKYALFPPTQPTAPPAAAPTTAAPGAELDALIAEQGSVTFRSWNGKWIGIDGDTDMTFLPGRVVHMFEYGFAMTGYRGTFTADGDGTVVVRFPTFGHAWPAMSLRKDATSLLLYPKEEGGGGLVMGNRGGVTVTSGQASYWPFRQIPLADEARAREDIRTRGAQ